MSFRLVTPLTLAVFALVACSGQSSESSDMSPLDASKLLQAAGVPCENQGIERLDAEASSFGQGGSAITVNLPPRAILTCEAAGGGFLVLIAQGDAETREGTVKDFCLRLAVEDARAQGRDGGDSGSLSDTARPVVITDFGLAAVERGSIVGAQDLVKALGGTATDATEACLPYEAESVTLKAAVAAQAAEAEAAEALDDALRDPIQALLLAQDPDTSEEVLMRLAVKDNEGALVKAIAGNPNATEEIFEYIFLKERSQAVEKTVHNLLAGDEHTPVAILEELAQSNDRRIKLSAERTLRRLGAMPSSS